MHFLNILLFIALSTCFVFVTVVLRNLNVAIFLNGLVNYYQNISLIVVPSQVHILNFIYTYFSTNYFIRKIMNYFAFFSAITPLVY
jgi:hypothetical protein